MTDSEHKKKLIANPEDHFESPHDVADDPRLTLEEKLQALKGWEERLRKQIADETEDYQLETDPRKTTVPGKSLQHVQEAMEKLFQRRSNKS